MTLVSPTYLSNKLTLIIEEHSVPLRRDFERIKLKFWESDVAAA